MKAPKREEQLRIKKSLKKYENLKNDLPGPAVEPKYHWIGFRLILRLKEPVVQFDVLNGVQVAGVVAKGNGKVN